MQKDKSALGKSNKIMGSTGERYYRDEFRSLGYTKCVTSRLGSRLHDNVGIDLIFIPYNVQVKVGAQRGLKPAEELKKIQDGMIESFPEDSVEFEYPKLVIHRKIMQRGQRRSEFDELVTMTFADFKKMASQVKAYNDIIQKKKIS